MSITIEEARRRHPFATELQARYLATTPLPDPRNQGEAVDVLGAAFGSRRDHNVIEQAIGLLETIDCWNGDELPDAIELLHIARMRVEHEFYGELEDFVNKMREAGNK